MDVNQRLHDDYEDLKEKYYKLSKAYPNAVYYQQRYAVLIQKASDLDEEVKQLKQELKKKNTEVEYWKRRKGVDIQDLPADAVILQVSPKEYGYYVPATTHQKIIEQLRELKKIKNETDKSNQNND